MSEIAFEALYGALETTNGTPVDPTHRLVMSGKIVPEAPRVAVAERRGRIRPENMADGRLPKRNPRRQRDA